ncbi:MAG: integrase arm-type DNA-binding domain-containing protein [Methylocella sp.]
MTQRQTLSTKLILSLKPEAKSAEISDGGCPGLRLVVFPTGRKSWIMRFRRPDGRSAKLTLGPFDDGSGIADPAIGRPMTLAIARKFAAAAVLDRLSGQDPAAAKIEAAASEASERSQKAFGALAVDFVLQHAKPRTRRWVETAHFFGFTRDLAIIPDGLADRWATKAVADVTKRDIVALLDEIRNRTVPGAKRRRKEGEISDGVSRAMFARLSTFFKWCIGRGLLERSPMEGLSRPKINPSRDRILSDEEIKRFWTACDQFGYPYGHIFKFLLISGQRLNEVGGLRRDELKGGEWHIPASRTKNRRPHFVPLTPLMNEIIASAPEDRPFVFTVSGIRPARNFGLAKSRLDQLFVAPHWTLHDLRRTAASKLASLAVNQAVTEKILNHVGQSGGLVQIYQRYDFAAERRAALELLESAIRIIIS